jgi:hypothetical protein
MTDKELDAYDRGTSDAIKACRIICNNLRRNAKTTIEGQRAEYAIGVLNVAIDAIKILQPGLLDGEIV